MLTFLFLEAYLLRVWQHHHQFFFFFNFINTLKKVCFRRLLPSSGSSPTPSLSLQGVQVQPEVKFEDGVINAINTSQEEGGYLPPVIPESPPSRDSTNRREQSRRICHSRTDSGFVERPVQLIFDILNSSTSAMSIEEKFQAAVKVIQSLPNDGPYQPTNDTKLKFYGLYKQATEGPCNVSKPPFYDPVGRYKWDAWKKNGSISKEDAMARYVDGLKQIVETMSFNGDVQDFLDSIGPFYEFVNLQGPEMNHIKGKIDTLTSSSSSSNTTSGHSSIVPSPANSCPNSPLRYVSVLPDAEDEVDTSSSLTKSQDMQNGVHEKAEVQVESRTATYETSQSQATAPPVKRPEVADSDSTSDSKPSESNGNVKSNGQLPHGIPQEEPTVDRYLSSTAQEASKAVTPPTPQHRRSSKTYQNVLGSVDETTVCNGSIPSNGCSNMDEEDEVIRRMGPASHQGQVTFAAVCKDDLEHASSSSYSATVNANRNKRASWGGSRDTIPSTTSGTESEKYYSGDSEPEVDERYANFFSHQQQTLGSNPGTSAAALLQGSPPLQNSVRSSASKAISNGSSNNGGNVRSRREKSSPKGSLGGLSQFVNPSATGGDLVLQSTVERLNRDVDHILARLRILEALYSSSTNAGTEIGAGRTRRRRFFEGLTNANVAFIVMWPFAVHFLIKLVSWWWRRRRMNRALLKAVVDCGSRRN